MKARGSALESAVTLVALAMRFSPLERDLFAAGLFMLLHRLWPPED